MKLLTKTKRVIKNSERGFTLIELLVVIGILAILLAITLIAINPNKHFEDVRNTQRSSNVSAILDGIYEYESANSGNEPAAVKNVGALPLPIGKATVQSPTTTSFSTPDLTYTVSGGNTLTSGNVVVSGCTNAANDGDFTVLGSSDSTDIIVDNPAGVASDTSCSVSSAVDLCPALAPTYLADMPTDPKVGSVVGGATPCNVATTSYSTGYTISASSGRFTIAAPAAEDSQVISVTR